MNYIRNVLSDAKLKYRISRVVTQSATHCSPDSFRECVAIADSHPTMVLPVIRDHMSYSQPVVTWGAVTLLEHLVSSCNYAFHTALSQYTPIQEKVLSLAIRRVEDAPHRRVQRLCRLTILEWSRMFVDDKALQSLSRLVAVFESRTRKSLMRCLNVQNRKVVFRAPRPQDIVLLSPAEDVRRAAGVSPVSFSAAEVWLCPVCGYMNSPSALRCAACETVHIGCTDNINTNNKNNSAAVAAAAAAEEEAAAIRAENEATPPRCATPPPSPPPPPPCSPPLETNKECADLVSAADSACVQPSLHVLSDVEELAGGSDSNTYNSSNGRALAACAAPAAAADAEESSESLFVDDSDINVVLASEKEKQIINTGS